MRTKGTTARGKERGTTGNNRKCCPKAFKLRLLLFTGSESRLCTAAGSLNPALHLAKKEKNVGFLVVGIKPGSNCCRWLPLKATEEAEIEKATLKLADAKDSSVCAVAAAVFTRTG